MDNAKLTIREKHNQMGKGEKCIPDFVLSNVTDCLSMTAVDIAKKSGVSSAFVIRHVQKPGYNGLGGFKLALAAANSQNNEWKMVNPIISTDDSLDKLVDKLGALIDGAMKDFSYQLGRDALQEATNVVKHARRICLTGIGASTLPAYDLFHKLKRADFNASYYFDANMQVEFFNYTDECDVIIVFSYSGQSQEILYPCRIAKEMKSKVIAMIRNRESALQQTVDICLTVPDREVVMRIGTFTSPHTSTMMGDLLYLDVIQEDLGRIEMGFTKTRKLVEGFKTGFWGGSIYDKY